MHSSVLRGVLISATVIGFVNVLGFTITATTGTHKVTDLCGTGAFVVSTVASAFFSQSYKFSRQFFLSLGISLWGIRLASYLFYRVLITTEDKRLREFFPKEGEGWLDKNGANFPLKLGVFWTLQSVWAFVVLLPSTICFFSRKNIPLTWRSHLIYAAFLTGFFIESVADYQKFVFKSSPENSSKWIDSGLWHYTRHPNYFGEILVWCSLFLYCLPTMKGFQYASVVSPLFITYLLYFVSGIPILEKKHDEQWGNDPLYQDYKQRTGLLLPRLPKN